MVGITHKNTTLRVAIAEATVSVSSEETIKAIKERKVPKGDVLEMAKTAGLFAVKKTSDMIPDCHPLPVEFTAVTYDFEGMNVRIRMEVHAIYRTGVEVEAMHGVSVVALTMYDMLKPIDKGVEINNIRLVEKKGGKSQWKKFVADGISAQIVVCSDTVAAGGAEDKAGAVIEDKLKAIGVALQPKLVIPDDTDAIRDALAKTVEQGTSLLIYTGGTGLSVRDVTPESIIPELDRRIPGIEEAIRSYGQERTPLAMLSRRVAGV